MPDKKAPEEKAGTAAPTSPTEADQAAIMARLAAAEERAAEAEKRAEMAEAAASEMAMNAAEDAPAIDAGEVVPVRCIVSNVHTSAGKIFMGDEALVPASDIPMLAGKVEPV